MKKIIAVILIAVCILSLASCGNEKVTKITKSVSAIKETLSAKFDLSDLDLLTNEDENSSNLLFLFGVNSGILENVDSYFITNTHRSTDARAIAVFKLKDDAPAEAVEALKKGINDTFLTNLVNMTATYDPEQAKIVNAANFREYDNALVFVSYDTEGNEAVYNAIEGK